MNRFLKTVNENGNDIIILTELGEKIFWLLFGAFIITVPLFLFGIDYGSEKKPLALSSERYAMEQLETVESKIKDSQNYQSYLQQKRNECNQYVISHFSFHKPAASREEIKEKLVNCYEKILK